MVGEINQSTTYLSVINIYMPAIMYLVYRFWIFPILIIQPMQDIMTHIPGVTVYIMELGVPIHIQKVVTLMFLILNMVCML